MSAEEWRPVVGYEGLYEVSSIGRVRSVDRITGVQRRVRWKGRILNQNQKPKGGYFCVQICGLGMQRTFNVHRLVADAFLGPRPDGMDTCHNDGDNLNNRVENLRYDTRTANMYDAVAHGTHASSRITHCPQGHEYTPENTRRGTHKDGGPFRKCRTCVRADGERRRAVRRSLRTSAADEVA